MDYFMEGYLKSDSITYFGSDGIKRGHSTMLERYKKRYPTQAHTGTLNFTIHNIGRIEDDSYCVMGEYHLTREMVPERVTTSLDFWSDVFLEQNTSALSVWPSLSLSLPSTTGLSVVN